MEVVSFKNNSVVNGGGLFIDSKSRAIVITSTFHSNFARDRGRTIAVRWQSTIFINETNIYNNTVKWGAAISNCNGHTELRDLLSTIDPIYTYCTIYNGYSDNYRQHDGHLQQCKCTRQSLTQLSSHDTFTKWSTTTVMPSKDSNFTERGVSTTMNYDDPETTTSYFTTYCITEVSTIFPDECLTSHSDTGYIVVVTVICLVLLGYIMKDLPHPQ